MNHASGIISECIVPVVIARNHKNTWHRINVNKRPLRDRESLRIEIGIEEEPAAVKRVKRTIIYSLNRVNIELARSSSRNGQICCRSIFHGRSPKLNGDISGTIDLYLTRYSLAAVSHPTFRAAPALRPLFR